MDAGLSATLSREFAKGDIFDPYHHNKLSTFRTLELCYFVGITLVSITFFLMSDFIAVKWLNLIDSEKSGNFITLMGILASTQLLINFYSGGFTGLEKQVELNLLNIFLSLVRTGGGILYVWITDSDIYVFFIWQVISGILCAIIFRSLLIRNINGRFNLSSNIKYNFAKLNEIKSFALGMFFISFVAALNSQLDKLVISKLLSVKELGFYTLSNSITLGIIAIGLPFSSVLMPRFTSLFTNSNIEGANKLFNFFCTLLSVILAPIALYLVFFNSIVLEIWINNIEIVKQCTSIVPYLALGSFFLAMQVIPFAVSIANGKIRVNNVIGILTLFITIPGYYWGVYLKGSVGAGICWAFCQFLVLPFLYYFVCKIFFKRRNIWKIFYFTIFRPLLIAFIVYLPFYCLYKFYFSELIPNIFLSIVAYLVVNIVLFAVCFNVKGTASLRKNILGPLNSPMSDV